MASQAAPATMTARATPISRRSASDATFVAMATTSRARWIVASPATIAKKATPSQAKARRSVVQGIVIRGRADKVHQIASKLIATKGVQNGKLVTTMPETRH